MWRDWKISAEKKKEGTDSAWGEGKNGEECQHSESQKKLAMLS